MFMIMVLFTVGRGEEVQTHLDKMDSMSINYHRADALERIANSSIHSEDYQWTLKFYEELASLEPNNPDYLINIALSYLNIGEKEKAILIAKKVGGFGGDYANQSEMFIQDILSGKYD